jgi:hypothetical protein
MRRDDLLPQETSLRRNQQRMDEAFCDAMFKAIDTGQECPPTAISTEPGTKTPISRSTSE